MRTILTGSGVAAAIAIISAVPGIGLRATARQAPLLSSPFVEASSPAPAGSAQPRLTTDAKGRVLVSWLAPVSGGGHTFQFSELAGDRWTAPRTIAEGPRLLANWADFPSLFVTRNGLMAAHWLERRGQSRTAYDVKLRTSRDDGCTWTNEVTPHRDGSDSEHGFVSFFETPGKELGLIWLDGREAGGHGGHGGQMTLRSAMVSSQGVAGAEMVVDGRVCDCCQTAATMTDTAALVAYRDRSDKEIRDIYVSRFEGGKWSEGTRVHADDWEINGCPVNGPAIAARGQSVAVAWFSAKDNTPKTHLVFSKDGGRTFGSPVRIDSGTTLGRVGLTLLADGRALVSWIDNTGTSAQFAVRDVRPDGTLGAPVIVGPIYSGSTSGFPQVAVSGRKVIAAWTNAQKGAVIGVSVATATLAR